MALPRSPPPRRALGNSSSSIRVPFSPAARTGEDSPWARQATSTSPPSVLQRVAPRRVLAVSTWRSTVASRPWPTSERSMSRTPASTHGLTPTTSRCSTPRPRRACSATRRAAGTGGATRTATTPTRVASSPLSSWRWWTTSWARRSRRLSSDPVPHAGLSICASRSKSSPDLLSKKYPEWRHDMHSFSASLHPHANFLHEVRLCHRPRK
mmetsp:Transcript_31685/g.47300  ORF Transcript_31685/g.47300 Transcript_31685/m.47300 type:complete len:210 (+) Transcript_31685:192-821(+)